MNGGDIQGFLNVVGVWFLKHTLPILIIIFLSMIVLKAIGLLTAKASALLSKRKLDVEYEKRAHTLGSVIRWVLRMVILVVALIMLLSELGVEVGPVIAAAGVVGLAVGFGAQNLVADVITGFFILLEDQIRVGDVVQIGDKSGLVEQLNLRMVILRDVAGNVHFIRNAKIDVVTNMTKEFSRYVYSIGVAYREDVDHVTSVLKGIDEEIRRDPEFKDVITAPLEVMGLDEFGESAVIIKARTTTKPSSSGASAANSTAGSKRSSTSSASKSRSPTGPSTWASTNRATPPH